MKSLRPLRVVWLALTSGLFDLPGVPTDALAANSTQFVYIGTYTGAKSKGIYVARFDSASGKMNSPELAAETKNPTFLALHPNHRFLYAANEIGDYAGKPLGAVSAFEIDRNTGKLTPLNQENSGGAGPCHLAVDKTGNCVLVANYGSGSVAALRIGTDGRLTIPASSIQHRGSSINPQRQEGPHAHFIMPDAANRIALVCDLGLDKIFLYRLDARLGLLSPNEPPSVSTQPGAGPRHLAFHPNGQFVYVLNEMGCSLGALKYDGRRGTLKELQTISTLPDDFKGNNTCAEVQVHPSGRFVCCSNRGQNSIAVFALDSKNGNLRFIERVPSQGRTPRHFTFDPGGNWLLAENQDSDNVVVFAFDSRTGHLNPTDRAVEVGTPVCAVFLPTE